MFSVLGEMHPGCYPYAVWNAVVAVVFPESNSVATNAAVDKTWRPCGVG